MKALIIKSSYRSGSNSSILADKIAEGLSGSIVQIEDIGRAVISNCRGCYACMAPGNKSYCIIKDDMHSFYDTLAEADIIVFAAPIYWFNVCGQIKQFIDRMFAVAVLKNEQGKSVLADKTIAAALVYGDVDPLRSGCVNAVRMFQDLCSYTGAKWGGVVYGTANDPKEMLNNSALLEDASLLGKSLIQ